MQQPALRMALDISPMPAPRPRFRAMIVNGKAIGTAYSPKEYKDWMDRAMTEIYGAIQEMDILSGPLTVALVFTVKRPKTTKLSAPKPDVDNYAKAILDAMTKAGVWHDDSQVEFLILTKKWGDEDSIDVQVFKGVLTPEI